RTGGAAMSDHLSPARGALVPAAAEVLLALRQVVAAEADWRLDSRTVRPGDVFLACPGEVVDGRRYVEAAVAAGVAGVVYEAEARAGGWTDRLPRLGVPTFALTNLQARAAGVAAAWYDHPAESLTVIAVTGTNGKTSCTQWLAQALTRLGRPCG